MIRVLILGFIVVSSLCSAQSVVVGSKNFSESRLLAEIIAQTIEASTNLEVERRLGLGGTLIAFEALKSGEIDIYPEYTGTINEAILDGDAPNYLEELSKLGIRCGRPFGFNNTYVLVTRENSGLHKISDLRGHNDLVLGFSNEFIKRGDGFNNLNRFYQLNLSEPKGIEHGLAYKALAEVEIDVTDAYSTDGKLSEFGFKYLEDDLGFFPEYLALPLINAELMESQPEIPESLSKIQISEEEMIALNYEVEVEKRSLTEVASEFLLSKGLAASAMQKEKTHPIIEQTLAHLRLTFLGTLLAILIAVPLGVYIQQFPRVSGLVVSGTGIIQTVPGLALLGFMIPLFGIGFLPAVIALFLYALLPIIRNTNSGLSQTDPLLIEAARCLGMTDWQILVKVRLPLAAPIIMAGIRTALVINIGTATLAAFIGAGGLGESIITGISLNDNSIILQGAIPAALLAILADLGMGQIEKKLRVNS
ncbi:MAG: ABC transporter permease subunit [Flavobacteriales bacterium]|nr:ABC transporter permease subunit [Flavobacteriales bacterium]